jgi:SET domain-containing protein
MTKSPIHLILKPSSVDGIGVFALTPIKKGDKVPLFNEDDSTIISREDYLRMPEAYSKYHVPDAEERWWGPIDYHRMSIGWYLNHSKTPNIDILAGFTALHQIEAGEELTIDYSYCHFDWVTDKAKRQGRPLHMDSID